MFVQHFILEGESVINLPSPTDSISLLHGNQDGVTFCGERSRLITQIPLGFDLYTYDEIAS